MLRNIKLGTKLLIALLAVGIIPFMIIGIISLMNSDNALSKQAFGKLVSIRELKKTHLMNFFTDRETDMAILMASVANFRQAAFDKMRTVQENKKAQVEEYFKKCFNEIAVISNNKAIADALYSFTDAVKEDGTLNESKYRFLDQETYGSSLRQFKEKYGFYDLLLINKDGTIVYALNKESDLNQNVVSGTLKNSTLARCFNKGLKEPVIEDYSLYPPSGNQYISFIAAPVLRYDEVIGTVILKLSKDPLNTIAKRRKGMGKTGETYIIGKSDGKTTYRNDRIVKAGKFGAIKRDDFIDKALAGESGTTVKIRSSTDTRFIVYDPLNTPGLNWMMATSVDLEEVIAPKLEEEEEDFFAKYVRKYGYHDLFLIHPKGEVFYSVAHEADYQSNIINGKYADSGLGKVVRNVLESKSFGFADFQPYPPSDGKPSAFIAHPVIHNGEIEMIVVLQFFNDAINAVMQERAGLGKTEETYLVGFDNLMRSDSYLHPDMFSVNASFANPVERHVDTDASRGALSGKTGYDIIRNFDGTPVLSAYTPLDIWGTKWALIAEINKAEALAPVNRLRLLMGIIAVISVCGIIIVAFSVSGYLTKPLGIIVDSANRIAQGDFDIEINIHQRDEIGNLADAFRNMKNSINHLLKELTGLLLAVQEGNLHSRGTQDIFAGNWRDLAMGINKVIDAFVSPIHVSAKSLDMLAKGNIPERIAAEYKGDFNEIINNLNGLIDATNMIENIAGEIADGNLAVEIKERSKNDRMMKSLNQMIRRLNDIMNETKDMIQAVAVGKLDIRGNAEAFQGGWQELIVGINELIGSLSNAVSKSVALSQEMELARKIQTVLLPGQPEIRGYEISASMEPCEQVGGDYYDVISIGGYDWIVIGDVSGHGVTAGLIMMMVQTAIHTILVENPEVPPSHLLSVINKSIYNNIEKMGESKHMTIVVLAAGKDGKFSFSGLHEDILIRRAKTGKVESVESGGMWIGLEPDISDFLSDDTFRLDPGDCMVLFTDGITEAVCERGELFGDEYLIEILEKSVEKSAAEVCQSIISALEPCEKPDDVTLVVMKRV